MKKFAEGGGALIAFGGSAVLGHHLGLPIDDHLVEAQQDGSERSLPSTKFYIPGSVLHVAVDNTNPGIGTIPRRLGAAAMQMTLW